MAEKRPECSDCGKEVPYTYVVDMIPRPTEYYCTYCWIEAMDISTFILHLNAMSNAAIHRLEELEPRLEEDHTNGEEPF